MNARRALLHLLAAASFAPRRALAQEKKHKAPARVGILMQYDQTRQESTEKPLFDALGELGWIEGRNIVFDRRYANEDAARLPALADELLARHPDVLYVATNQPAQVLFSKTRSIPIVFSAVSSPVEQGLVKSLARPGTNVTGVLSIGWELAGKRLQLLKETVPTIARIGVLHGNTQNSPREVQLLIESGARLAVSVVPFLASRVEQFESAFAAFAAARVDAVLTTQNPSYVYHAARIVELASKQRIPVVGHRPEVVAAGGLLSYSSLLSEQIQRAAHHIDKILRGRSPADLPVEQSTRFELVLNLKTAKLLGIAVPPAIRVQATVVIE